MWEKQLCFCFFSFLERKIQFIYALKLNISSSPSYSKQTCFLPSFVYYWLANGTLLSCAWKSECWYHASHMTSPMWICIFGSVGQFEGLGLCNLVSLFEAGRFESPILLHCQWQDSLCESQLASNVSLSWWQSLNRILSNFCLVWAESVQILRRCIW